MGIRADDFTEASTVSPTAHTPTGANAGTGWTLEATVNIGALVAQVDGADDAAKASGDRADSGMYLSLQPNPTVDQYDVQFTITAIDSSSANHTVGLIGRGDAGSRDNLYEFNIGGTGSFELWKRVAGVSTQLASFAGTLNVNDVFKLEIRTATKKGYENGVERVSSADNAITQVGRAGLCIGEIAEVGNNTRTLWRLDGFSYTEFITGPIAGLRTMGLTGVGV